MADVSQPNQPRKDPADALADMASTGPLEIVPPPDPPGGPKDPFEALTQMAEAEDETIAPDPDAAGPPDDALDLGMAETIGVAGAEAFRARQVRARAVGADTRRVHTHAYKKLMIPLLLVVGALLVLVAALSALMLVWHRGQGSNDEALALVTLVSFPLAGVMAFGAWWFHRDVRRR